MTGQKVRQDKVQEHLNLRLIVTIPVVFILISLSVGLLAMTLTQFLLRPAPPTSKDLLLLRLWIIGSSLLAGLMGALLAYGITKPVRRAILEAQKMIQYVKADPPPIKASNEVGALSDLFDQAYVSFVELVQAREMLDGINEGIVALDREGKIASMNLKAQDIFEISLEEARQKDFREALGPAPENGALWGISKNVLRDHEERVHNRFRFYSRSGKETLLSVKVSPLKFKSEAPQLLGAVVSLKEQVNRSSWLPEIIGRSEPFMEALDLVAKIAPTDSTVLITGESGTGKELIANAIHRLSRRREKPFVKLNCAAIPEGLLESDLFGHEKGAFTGAVSKKPGKFELADGGTIFLDEIGDMSPSTQAKVLRVLQQREFTSVGGSQVKRVDVRILAATNKDLLEEVEQGTFREDLFYRLNVMTINIPPLRERKTDIPHLAEFFLEEAAKHANHEKKSLSRDALDCLLGHPWPGNVRELQNVIERASLLSDGPVIEAKDLPFGREERDSEGASSSVIEDTWLDTPSSLNETMEAVEKELIIRALRKSRGVQAEAAKLLGLERKNLWHKIRKHNIDVSTLKENGR